MEHIVFLTGRLAQFSLQQVLKSIAPIAQQKPFTWEVREIGLQVAGLMTADMIRRRVAHPLTEGTSRMIVPGRCRGDLEALTAHYGVKVERGPEEVKDLPQFFWREAKHVDLSRYETEIFAEIVDGPRLDLDGIAARASEYKRQGADVIDVGCRPSTPFPHLEDAVVMLKEQGYRVSVDSMQTDELLRGRLAGADYIMSLNADTLWVADEIESTPIRVPREPANVASLDVAIEALQQRGRPFLADPILDPIPFGLAASIARYVSLRERHPQVAIMMGIGNVTELTEADTTGINAVLFGMAAELRIAAVLTTSVSLHARRAVHEADVARRLMHAARETKTLPKGISADLSALHSKRPFPYDAKEIDSFAYSVRYPNF
ncbi:Dihydropteroate synthase [Candidatus Burkholderia pumila]|uniref:Dihydropteroate synthase n=1 Tax=Candidatus Burkholderia pumila TaxID=1090375 RepID=A0ABR5HNY4_9BURK|nr:Dihydropteroate synthase [Candidatus Burkholderia pumila]